MLPAEGGRIVVGAVLESKGGKRSIELTGSHEERLYRIPEASALFRGPPRVRVERASLPPALPDLDRLLQQLADNSVGFSLLADKDPLVAWVTVYPRAAVLARWGPKGERATRRLPVTEAEK